MLGRGAALLVPVVAGMLLVVGYDAIQYGRFSLLLLIGLFLLSAMYVFVWNGDTRRYLRREFIDNLVDLRESHPDLTGQEAENALEAVGITVNKNTIPGESRSPFVTSGIRVGTPAVTTRGFTELTMEEVANLIVDVLDDPADDDVAQRVSARVDDLADEYPIYD